MKARLCLTCNRPSENHLCPDCERDQLAADAEAETETRAVVRMEAPPRRSRREEPLRLALAVPYDTIEPEEVDWLWEPWVPIGGVTMLAGDPGLGKSLLTCLLAARLSRGELTGQPDASLLATAEDHHAAVVRPRLEAAGASLGRVHAVKVQLGEIEDGLWLPDDVGQLDALVAEHAARLVVIDPIMAHLPERVNSHRDQAVRLALAPMHRIAGDRHCAVVIVAHLNKSASTDPLLKTGGSMGFSAAARSVLLLTRDPEDEDADYSNRRVLAQTKSNYGETAKSLAFEIVRVPLPTGDTPAIRQVGESGLSGRELLGGAETGKTKDAMDFLRDVLADGPKASEDVKKEADEEDIAPKTLRKAREKLGVVVVREVSGHTTWGLPVAASSPRPSEGHEGARGGTRASSGLPAPGREEGHEGAQGGTKASRSGSDAQPSVLPAPSGPSVPPVPHAGHEAPVVPLPPFPGDADFLPWFAGQHQAGQVTEGEHRRRRRLHLRLVGMER